MSDLQKLKINNLKPNTMNFKEALQKLGIEDYAERIWHSNSHGELFHLEQYLTLSEKIKNETKWFRAWFEETVKYAEANWERPESVFQHISKIIEEQCKNGGIVSVP